jgi:hypothetical protein
MQGRTTTLVELETAVANKALCYTRAASRPVSKTIGVAILSARNLRVPSKPSRSGNITSSKTMSKGDSPRAVRFGRQNKL